jgi:hypothetical protein
MKTLFSLLLLLTSVYFSYGQKALTFTEAIEQGLSSAHLDSVYASGINSDTTLAVFKNNQEEYIKSYQNLLQISFPIIG